MEANLLRTTCVTVSITVEVQKISKYLWIQTKRGSEKKYKGTKGKRFFNFLFIYKMLKWRHTLFFHFPF